jgi:hypothetical protein
MPAPRGPGILPGASKQKVTPDSTPGAARVLVLRSF